MINQDPHYPYFCKFIKNIFTFNEMLLPSITVNEILVNIYWHWSEAENYKNIYMYNSENILT